MDITMLRMGPFKIGMTKSVAQKQGKQKINFNLKDGEFQGEVMATYNGEKIKLTFFPGASDARSDYIIAELSTTSTKFRTKSGMGVGSTRYELLNVYKDYSQIELYPAKGESGKRLANESYFELIDEGALARLSFKLVNNVVTEVAVHIYYPDSEGW